MSQTDARVIRTTRKINETAMTLMITQPDFSITTLLTRAGITRGTFYKYYSNKDHLTSEVNSRLIDRLAEHTGVKFQIAPVINVISEEASFYNAVLNMNSNSTFYDSLLVRLRKQLNDQIESLDKNDQQHVRYQWEIINAGFWAVVGKWLRENMSISQTELLMEFSSVWRTTQISLQPSALDLFDFSPLN